MVRVVAANPIDGAVSVDYDSLPSIGLELLKRATTDPRDSVKWFGIAIKSRKSQTKSPTSRVIPRVMITLYNSRSRGLVPNHTASQKHHLELVGWALLALLMTN
jgi:hypothetical protein